MQCVLREERRGQRDPHPGDGAEKPGGFPGGGLITLGSLQARPRVWVSYSKSWLRKSSRQGDE